MDFVASKACLAIRLFNSGFPMVQRTVLKVSIPCLKCKRKLFKAVSTIEGIDKIEIDAEKGTITVTGNADPYEIIVRIRKTGKQVEVVSVGPPPASPKKPWEKKPEQKMRPEEKPLVHDPRTCTECQRLVFVPVSEFYGEPSPGCSIM